MIFRGFRVFKILTANLLGFTLLACGGVQRPAWMAAGESDDVLGRYVPGTGFASGPDAQALALQRASDEARAAFARSLSSLVESSSGTEQVEDRAGHRGKWWLTNRITAHRVEIRGSCVVEQHTEAAECTGAAGVQAWVRLFVPTAEVDRLKAWLEGERALEKLLGDARAALAVAYKAPAGWPNPAQPFARLAEVARQEGLNAEPVLEPLTDAQLQAKGVAWKVDVQLEVTKVAEDCDLACAWLGLTWNQRSTTSSVTTSYPVEARKGCSIAGDRAGALERAFDAVLLDLVIELGRVGK